MPIPKSAFIDRAYIHHIRTPHKAPMCEGKTMKAQTTKNSKNSVLSRNNIANALKANALGRDNEGVSAVIGVILMVAITVIAAAIIGTFVLGIMGNQPQAPGFAAFSAERLTDNTISIKNVAPQGQAVTVTKIINADTGHVIIDTPATLADLSELLTPVIVPAASLDGTPSEITGGFNMAIVGKSGGATSDNVLQTIYVNAGYQTGTP